MEKLLSGSGGGNIAVHVPVNHVDIHGEMMLQNGFRLAEAQKIIGFG